MCGKVGYCSRDSTHLGQESLLSVTCVKWQGNSLDTLVRRRPTVIDVQARKYRCLSGMPDSSNEDTRVDFDIFVFD